MYFRATHNIHMIRILLPLTVALGLTSSLKAQNLSLKNGSYSSYLQLNQTTQLPVHLTVDGEGKAKHLTIHNGDEAILLSLKEKNGDTLVFPFPNFDSELRVVALKKTGLSGVWLNKNKAGNYRIPFEAKWNGKAATIAKVDPVMNGKWETTFSPNTSTDDKGIGVYEQKGSAVFGTVLTETGDYRYLQGTVVDAKFYLAAFDGTHAFLLQGTVDGDLMEGTFYSGKHYQTPFVAKRNPNATLANPDSLTYVKNGNEVQFSLPTLTGENYTFPNAQTKGKVVIIQIMGTWCPNCMDETNFYKQLYAQYHDKGLEIISIGYEAADSFKDQAAKIEALKQRHHLDFTFLVGGKANKSLASSQFKMLNEVISFPTSIYIGKDGQVKRIHTGFNGPGTGSYYTEYVDKTKALIEQLLAE